VISNATPKIASYPFTTLVPHIGMIEFKDYSMISVADLPGLIEGAHKNIGLGHEFLKHIERTKALCFVLDMSSSSPSPFQCFVTLQKEIELYNRALLDKPCLIAANKVDLKESARNLKELRNQIQNVTIIPISAKKKFNIDEFRNTLKQLVLKKS